MENAPQRILAAVQDLFFAAKITTAAGRVGVPVEFVHDPNQLWAESARPADMVLVDLNNTALDPIPLIRKLKGDPQRKNIRIVAYLSHVQHEPRREAEQAGCDLVLPRSAFSQNLGELLRGRSGQM